MHTLDSQNFPRSFLIDVTISLFEIYKRFIHFPLFSLELNPLHVEVQKCGRNALFPPQTYLVVHREGFSNPLNTINHNHTIHLADYAEKVYSLQFLQSFLLPLPLHTWEKKYSYYLIIRHTSTLPCRYTHFPNPFNTSFTTVPHPPHSPLLTFPIL